MTERLSIRSLVGKGYGDFWRCRKRYRIVKGSRGSKKSKTAALWFVANMLANPMANTLVIRKTGATLRNSCYSDLLWAIDRLGMTGSWRATVNPLELTRISTGQKILFRGLDDGLKITSISVPTGVLCWVWCEEAYEITKEDDFNKLDMSIRGEMPDGLFKQITLTFNPWSEMHWIKGRFFDVQDDDVFTKTTTYDCNEWLDGQDLRLFEKMREQNPRRYRIEGMGEWGIAEGLIFENVELREFDIDAIRMNPGVQAGFGLDFGFTDPNAFVAVIVDNSTQEIYIFDELYEGGLTNRQIADRIMAMGYGGQRIYCDSAEPKSIAELRDYGLRTEGARKGRDSVNHGIQQIQNYRIIIHPKCVNTYRDFSNYCWKKDRFDKPTDTPDHEFSHAPDAVRYAVSRLLTGNTFSFD